MEFVHPFYFGIVLRCFAVLYVYPDTPINPVITNDNTIITDIIIVAILIYTIT